MRNKNETVHLLAREAKSRLKLIASGIDKSYATVLSKEDQILYEKVCKIVQSNKVITNPINELVDKLYYDSLSPDGKQRYIMYLSEKYIKLKQRYNVLNYKRNAM